LGRAAVPFVFFGALVLIVPAIGMPSSLRRRPEPVTIPAAAERALASVVSPRPPATPVSALVQPSALRATAAAVAFRVRTHVVADGDNLWAIARRYDVSVDAVVSANNLDAEAVLRLGRELTIPPAGFQPAGSRAGGSGSTRSRPRASAAPTVTYVVEPGDTLWSIAARHGSTVDDVMARNDLDDPERIKPGRRLVISGRVLPRNRQATAQPRRVAPSLTDPDRMDRIGMADDATLRTAGAFLWPSRGVLTSRFGLRRYRRHHDGIDLAAPHGTPIYATRDGVVEFSGWKQGFGRVVFVNHGGELVTVYGHASKLLVETGQTVKKGQLIAHVGCTGRCTGSHLHFEVRIDGRARNPLQYLQQ